MVSSARRAGRLGLAVLIAAGLSACAQQRPVLYPNSRYASSGAAVAEAEVEECMHLADSYVGNTRPAGETAKSTVAGAAVGSAVGAAVGAVRGRAGRDAAAGAAGGGTAGLLRGIFRSRRNDPIFQRFVERCLRDRGYEPIGWR